MGSLPFVLSISKMCPSLQPAWSSWNTNLNQVTPMQTLLQRLFIDLRIEIKHKGPACPGSTESSCFLSCCFLSCMQTLWISLSLSTMLCSHFISPFIHPASVWWVLTRSQHCYSPQNIARMLLLLSFCTCCPSCLTCSLWQTMGIGPSRTFLLSSCERAWKMKGLFSVFLVGRGHIQFWPMRSRQKSIPKDILS